MRSYYTSFIQRLYYEITIAYLKLISLTGKGFNGKEFNRKEFNGKEFNGKRV